MTQTDTSKSRCEKCGASVSSDLTVRNLEGYPSCGDCGAVVSLVKDTSIRRLAELIEARNEIASAITALRGGHHATMDRCDEALAKLDIAIGQTGAALTTLATQIREEDARIAEGWECYQCRTAENIAAAIRARQEK